MIEYVEEVSRKSHVHALLNLEILEQGEICVPSSWSHVKRSGVGIDDVRHRREPSRPVCQYQWQPIAEIGSEWAKHPLGSVIRGSTEISLEPDPLGFSLEGDNGALIRT